MICSLSPETIIIAYNISELLKHGISLDDMATFIEQGAGGKYFDHHCVSFPLPQGCACFIPNGYAVTVLIIATETGKNDKDKKDEEAQCGMVWHVPICSNAWLKGLDVSTRQAIGAFNLKHFESATPRKVWAPKKVTLQKIMKDVDVAL